MSDDVLPEFQRHRVEEITKKLANRGHFGQFVDLQSGGDFLAAVEVDSNSLVLRDEVHKAEKDMDEAGDFPAKRRKLAPTCPTRS